MDIDPLRVVRGLCMDLPAVSEAQTHGAPTWFVDGRRSFAKFVDPAIHRFEEAAPAIWAAAPPGARQELVSEAPDRFFEPPFGGARWIGMRLAAGRDGVDWAEVAEILDDAYREVAPAYLIERMRPRPGGPGPVT